VELTILQFQVANPDLNGMQSTLGDHSKYQKEKAGESFNDILEIDAPYITSHIRSDLRNSFLLDDRISHILQPMMNPLHHNSPPGFFLISNPFHWRQMKLDKC
jgi:hypothetical protein